MIPRNQWTDEDVKLNGNWTHWHDATLEIQTWWEKELNSSGIMHDPSKWKREFYIEGTTKGGKKV